MFQIKADYSDQVEVKAGVEQVRVFFTDLRNFIELMPGVESITTEADGTKRWVIRADVPLLGAMRAAFVVQQTIDEPQRIEWSPAAGEKNNLLRYAASFEPQPDNGSGVARTLIRIQQQVEMRRASAGELHTFAGWAGEKRISAQMQSGVEAMMRKFLKRIQEKLNR